MSDRELQNVTVTVDKKTLADARVEAAERNMSLSRFIGEILRERRMRRNDYEAAMKRYFANDFVIPRAAGDRWLTREEINDRAAMRKEHEAALRKDAEANERSRIRRR